MLAARVYRSQQVSDPNKPTPWLIWLHGLLGSAEDWSSVVNACDGYSSLVVDLPAHGDSYTQTCKSFSEFNEQLSELLLHYKIDEYYLIGYSLGARLAMYFSCFSQPKGLKGLVIEGGNVGLSTEEERTARLKNDSAWAARFRTEAPETVLNDWYQQPVFSHLTSEQRQKLIALRRLNNLAAVADMLESTSLAKQPFLADKLHQLTFPFRYFCGENDQKFRGVSQQYALPFTLIANAGHNAHRENPQAYVTALHYFLSHCG